jgi:hypothetical protein
MGGERVGRRGLAVGQRGTAAMCGRALSALCVSSTMSCPPARSVWAVPIRPRKDSDFYRTLSTRSVSVYMLCG